MITDFSTYTDAGLRNITYNGKNSLTDYGILITTDSTNVENLNTKTITENVPYIQGNIDMSRYKGVLYYEPRVLVYRFKVFGEDREDLKEKTQDVLAWLNSSGNYQIIDSDYGSDYAFQNCNLKSIESEPGEYTSVEYSYITATFEAAPYMINVGAVNDKILSYVTTENSTITVTNNSSYTITKDGSTSESTSFTANSPYTYRLVIYSKNTPTVTLNGTALDISKPFTMPANASIAITHTGYGYYELRHDTRELKL